MSVCIQMRKENKRMCVYSERDFEYMKGKGWTKYEPPAPDPVPVVAAPLAPEPKKRGRKPKAK